MAVQASSVKSSSTSYAEASKKLRAFLPTSRFCLKENISAISGAISFHEQYGQDFKFEAYLKRKGVLLSIRAGMEKEPAKANRIRRLAGECLVESIAIFEDKPRREIALGLKDMLSHVVAAFEEETPKIKDAGNLLSKGKAQDARGNLLYVYMYFGLASEALSKAGFRGLSHYSSEVHGEVARVAASLDHRTADSVAVENAKKAIAGIHSTAVQLLGVAKAMLASIESYCQAPKR
jgi:hypothetical protein